MTALMVAMVRNRTDVVQLLLRAGADLKAKDSVRERDSNSEREV
jgi:ankyrin repeat protein